MSSQLAWVLCTAIVCITMIISTIIACIYDEEDTKTKQSHKIMCKRIMHLRSDILENNITDTKEICKELNRIYYDE